MPLVYLSPSTQPFNLYATEGNEQEYMNKIADAMEPLLIKNNIDFVRNTPNTSVGVSVAESNQDLYDLHLSLHSNAGPESLSGKLRGIDAYYYEYSRWGKAAAEIFAENLKEIYPIPEKVRPLETTKLYELLKTNAPAVLLELGYHDNIEDEKWIKANIENIAQNLTESLCEYFGIPYYK